MNKFLINSYNHELISLHSDHFALIPIPAATSVVQIFLDAASLRAVEFEQIKIWDNVDRNRSRSELISHASWPFSRPSGKFHRFCFFTISSFLQRSGDAKLIDSLLIL